MVFQLALADVFITMLMVMARMPGDLWRQIAQLEECVGLTAQLIGDHGRRGPECADNGHPDATPLDGIDQAAKIAIAGK